MTNTHTELLDQLQRASPDSDRRVLLTGGTVLIMDPTHRRNARSTGTKGY